MRVRLFAAILALGISAASAQGTLTFLNASAPVYYPRFTGKPEGTGLGSDFTAYLEMDGETVASAPFISNANGGTGIFNGGTVTLDGVPGPGPVDMVVRISNSDYSLYGTSGIFPQPLGGVGTPPSTPANLAMPAFVVIPEPSHVALALLGGAVLLFSRRRKSRSAVLRKRGHPVRCSP